jgi:1-acyl-sn-glycerol-3-phosphate acyltransferase
VLGVVHRALRFNIGAQARLNAEQVRPVGRQRLAQKFAQGGAVIAAHHQHWAEQVYAGLAHRHKRHNLAPRVLPRK